VSIKYASFCVHKLFLFEFPCIRTGLGRRETEYQEQARVRGDPVRQKSVIADPKRVVTPQATATVTLHVYP
jgi:hypothetical protein